MEKLIPEKIVIVVGDRKNPHAHHIKLEGTVRMGRALSCDVILSDEHVEPLQLIVFEQEKVRKVQVMPGINPVLRNGDVVAAGIYDFVSGDEWSIGRTQLQVFDESHVPEPTARLVMKEYRGGRFAQMAIFFVALAALFGWLLFSQWIGDYEPLEWDKKIAEIITEGVLLMAFIWAAFWGVIGRMLTGRSQFLVHFIVFGIFVLADMCSQAAIEYLSYGTNHDVAWNIVGYGITALIIAVLFYSAFSYALNLRHARLLAFAIGAFGTSFTYFATVIDARELEPVFNDFVKPPFAVLAEPQTVEQFSVIMDDAFFETDELLE